MSKELRLPVAPIGVNYESHDNHLHLHYSTAEIWVKQGKSIPVTTRMEIAWLKNDIPLTEIVTYAKLIIEGNTLYGIVNLPEDDCDYDALMVAGTGRKVPNDGYTTLLWDYLGYLHIVKSETSVKNILSNKGTTMATMQPYYDLVKDIYLNGRRKGDRTGTGTISLFGAQMRFDLSKGFPLNTLKRTPMYMIANELIWFLSGSTDENELALMDRIYRESAAHYKYFNDIPEDEQLTVHEFFYNSMPHTAPIQEKRVELNSFYCHYPELQSHKGALTLPVIGKVVKFLANRGIYEWLHELEAKPTIWDEWATYIDSYCRGQLDWVLARSENNREVATRVENILQSYETSTEPFAIKVQKLKEATVNLSNELDMEIIDILYERKIGPMYGKQWRSYGDLEIDQIENAIETLRRNPTSRRICVSAWNPEVLPLDTLSPQENVNIGNMALAPCHAFFQFYADELTLDELLALPKVQDAIAFCAPEMVSTYIRDKQEVGALPKYRLSCQFYCRSQDVFLGTPFNIASYALLTHIIAEEVGMVVGDLIWTGGDVHLYSNHLEQVKTMLDRGCVQLPTIKLHHSPGDVMFVNATDIEVLGYNPHPAISAPVAI